ncbi:MAG: ferrous iron transport protein B [Oscillospiraceae bacterium]|nr:ferrous iron transport protein B [Oscillospiraceae bacterium]MBQ9250894.1 ferrous iron transport protein B [Oscillospiraceae bacterium]
MDNPIRIALAGNPNCGKTTLFNALTGTNQYVGNWPGVTVEKKEGKLQKHDDVIVTDLPGIYSLSPYTLEEVVARNYLIEERPDVILNIVDGTNLERNLYLTTQLTELGIPVVIALNMMDLVKRNGDKINTDELARQLGCRIVEISALKRDGVNEAAEAAIAAAKGTRTIPQHSFSGVVEHALAHIEEVTVHNLPEEQQRWYAIKLFERDEKVIEKLNLDPGIREHIEKDIAAAETELDDDAESIITNERYIYIGQLMKGCYKKAGQGLLTRSDKIDQIVTNRILALPIFAVVMWLVYWIAMGPFGSFLTDWTNDVLGGAWLTDGSRAILEGWGVTDWLTGLISDGILAGVGAVLGFVPQMLVLFLMLCLLEDCGYMARIAFIMDRIFRRFGLSGKSFIPMLVGTGCGVPGVMASRTIENERDRRMTIMTTCFIPCGAKMPIIGLIAGALFGGSGIVAVSAYFIGVAAIILSGIMLKKTKMFAGDPAPFVMELPAYHVPSLGNVLRGTWERGWSFIKRAGTVIVLSSIIIWFLSSFGTVNGRFGMVDDLFEDEDLVTEEYVAVVADRMGIPEDEVVPMDDSVLAGVGNAVAPVFKPLGFGSWKPTVATVTGLVAKEEVVGTFGVLYNYDAAAQQAVDEETGELLFDEDGEPVMEELDEEGSQVWANVEDDFNKFSGGHGKLAAFSFMLFNLLCAPCFAAMGAIKREMNNRKWTWFAIGYMCLFAYVVALMVYQIGGLFVGNVSVIGLIVALALLVLIIYQLFRPYKEAQVLTVQ